MSEYTRITVSGRHSRADLVVPDSESVASLLPEILTLLEEPHDSSASPIILTTLLGEQLDPTLSLSEQSIRHGTILNITTLDEAPPPPEVADVTDVAGDSTSSSALLWNSAWVVGLSSIGAFPLGLFTTSATISSLGLWTSAVGLALILFAGIITARFKLSGVATVLGSSALGAAWPLLHELIPALPLTGLILAYFATACGIVAILAGLGFGRGSMAVGATAGLLLALTWLLLPLTGMTINAAAGCVSLLGLIGIGLVPGIAMNVAGLTGLDDRIIGGEPVSRSLAVRSVTDAHNALTWAMVALSLPTCAAGVVLVLQPDVWGRATGLLTAVILLLRSRLLPLATERLAPLAGGGIVWLSFVFFAEGSFTDLIRVFIGVVAIVVLGVVTVYPATNYQVAQYRRLSSLGEAISVIAIVPVFLAFLGIFDDLAAAF